MELCRSNTPNAIEIQPLGNAFFEAEWRPLFIEQTGSQIGHLLILRDIAHRKQSERQMQDLLDKQTVAWREATASALRAAEDEQDRIGHELHDTLCHDLIGLSRNAEAFAGLASVQDRPEIRDHFTQLARQASEAAGRARNLAHLLARPNLEHTSFAELLAAQARELKKTLALSCELTLGENLPDIHAEAGLHIIRIAREAVSNAARHAGAKHVWIDLLHEGERLTLSISNDGAALGDPSSLVEGLGLRQMRMRAALIGGTLSLKPGQPDGAVVELTLAVTSTCELERTIP